MKSERYPRRICLSSSERGSAGGSKGIGGDSSAEYVVEDLGQDVFLCRFSQDLGERFARKICGCHVSIRGDDSDSQVDSCKVQGRMDLVRDQSVLPSCRLAGSY